MAYASVKLRENTTAPYIKDEKEILEKNETKIGENNSGISNGIIDPKKRRTNKKSRDQEITELITK